MRFYYDGARRIQEYVTEPVVIIQLLQTPEGGANNPELTELMNQTVPSGALGSGDGSANPLNFESGQLENPGPVIGSGGTPLPTSLTGLEREYVWGPGDNGLDEILVQYDSERKPFWMIQDGGGDVVAMCDLQGGGGSGGTARVVKSWQYDAYGQCLRATDVVAPTSNYSIPMNRIGHKGLFMDRLDKGLADPLTHADIPRLEAFSTVLYQNRNRTYSPQLGRFIQRDPNETGQFGSNPAKHGGVATRPSAEYELSESYQDGGSLHEYLGSSTLLRRDPMGHGFYIDLIVSTALRAGMFVLPGPRDMMIGASQGLIKGYALNQDEDVEWALDWNRLDDEHSRLDSQWMFYAMARGVYDSYEFGYGDYTFNPLDSFDPDAFETDQAGGPVAAFTRPPRFINPKGATGKLPAGYTYRVDSNDVSAAEGNFHIHVYKGSKQTKNNEVAKVTGNGGYVNHGGTNLRRASDMPREVRRDLNRIVTCPHFLVQRYESDVMVSASHSAMTGCSWGVEG